MASARGNQGRGWACRGRALGGSTATCRGADPAGTPTTPTQVHTLLGGGWLLPVALVGEGSLQRETGQAGSFQTPEQRPHFWGPAPWGFIYLFIYF